MNRVWKIVIVLASVAGLAACAQPGTETSMQSLEAAVTQAQATADEALAAARAAEARAAAAEQASQNAAEQANKMFRSSLNK